MSPNIKFGISKLKINTKHYIWLSYKRGVRAYPLPYVSYTDRCEQAKKNIVDKETLNKLQKGLDEIRIKTFELKRAKNKKDRKSVQTDITFFTDKLVRDFDLLQYDKGITEEKHNVGFFMFDVENILRDEKEKLKEEE